MKRIDPWALEKRLPIWKALSDLFLDTELDQSDFKRAAGQLRDLEFTTPEIQEILWEEVFPALGDNLRIGTGEWSDFSAEWLQRRILNVMNGSERGMGSYGLITIEQTRKIIDDGWREICRYLSDE